jgi:alkanesulfonate monooxygenase SsuD/methylene tetrahydromethanopterin reductase-like flavin-dependent oxidoreductase (luciferase family)
MSSRQLHLNVNLLHSGVYASAWRLPESDPRACFDVGHYVRVAQIAERGRLDAIFLADTPAITDRIEYRSFMSLEPTIVLATVPAVLEHKARCAAISACRIRRAALPARHAPRLPPESSARCQ